MKIMLVTWHFPPVNTVAALRTGKLAEYLAEQGVDTTVITVSKDSDDTSLPLNSDGVRIIETNFFDLDRWLNPVSLAKRLIRRIKPSRKAAAASSGPASSGGSGSTLPREKPPLWKFFSGLFEHLILYPDKYIGWFFKLYPAILREARATNPDFIIASGPPFTAFLAAAAASKRLGIPWIAEYRDRWMDDPYATWPQWRRRFDHWFEKKILSGAAAIITVSPKWESYFAETFKKPVGIFMNGFDPENFEVEANPCHEGLPLVITHMGRCYPERRDPSKLFEALKTGHFTPEEVTFRFYGWNLDYVAEKVKEHGVEAFVEILPPVPFKQSIALQKGCDVLLLMQWNNIADEGNIPAKLFEYLASRRPVIAVGCESGFVAETIHSRDAGLLSNCPEKLAAAMRNWVDEKHSRGRLPILPESTSAGLTRSDQLQKYLTFLQRGLTEKKNEIRASNSQNIGLELTSASEIEITRQDHLEKPLALVIVDTEEDFDWDGPFRRTGHSLASVFDQNRAQRIFDHHKIKPCYLIDYPILADDQARAVFREMHARGQCDLGVQMHPWINPPYQEWLNERNSYPHNLETALFREKLDHLIAAFVEAFDFRPRIFKAGRYGINRDCLDILIEYGFRVDTSVIPWSNYSQQSGPNFFGSPQAPFWFGKGRNILELPISRRLDGMLADTRAERLFNYTHSKIGERLKLGGVLSRGFLERTTLSPEGNSLEIQQRLIRRSLANGNRIFLYSYHSPSLAVGNTPYVQSEKDLEDFLLNIERFISLFTNEFDGRFVTMDELLSMVENKSGTGKTAVPGSAQR